MNSYKKPWGILAWNIPTPSHVKMVEKINVSELMLLFKELEKDSIVEYLAIESCTGIPKKSLPNCSVKHLYLGSRSIMQCVSILSENNTLTSLSIPNISYSCTDNNELDLFVSFIRDFNVNILNIGSGFLDIPCKIYENIFSNDNIVELCITQLPYSLDDLSNILRILGTNTKLESLTIINDLNWHQVLRLNMYIKLNMSLLKIEFFIENQPSRGSSDVVNTVLKRNRNLRWDIIHPHIVSIVIGMFLLEVNHDYLPPYIMLWIIDWIYEDNPYSTHLKKINLITSLHKSIRKIPRYSIDL